jgi:hypothetical protein
VIFPYFLYALFPYHPFTENRSSSRFFLPQWNRSILEWPDLKDISWHVILILGKQIKDSSRKEMSNESKGFMWYKYIHLNFTGGGFAIAAGFQSAGLSQIVANSFAQFDIPIYYMIGFLCFTVSIMTEFMSNTASVSILLPFLAAYAVKINQNPIVLMLPVTVSASFAFILPVSTPPNAIIFASNMLRVRDMALVQ